MVGDSDEERQQRDYGGSITMANKLTQRERILRRALKRFDGKDNRTKPAHFMLKDKLTGRKDSLPFYEVSR